MPPVSPALSEKSRLAVLLEHFSAIEAIATNGTIAQAIRNAGAHCLLAVKNNQPTLRAEVEACFTDAPQDATQTEVIHDKGHGRIESRLHWVLDGTFNEDQSRLRKGPGARNTAFVRHFALNRVRTAADKTSIKLRRKMAGWSTDSLHDLLAATVP